MYESSILLVERITGRHTNHPLDYTPGIERLIHNNCYNKSSCRTLIQSRWCLFTVLLPVWGLGWGEFWMFSHWPMMGGRGDQVGCPLPLRCDNLCTSGHRLEAWWPAAAGTTTGCKPRHAAINNNKTIPGSENWPEYLVRKYNRYPS